MQAWSRIIVSKLIVAIMVIWVIVAIILTIEFALGEQGFLGYALAASVSSHPFLPKPCKQHVLDLAYPSRPWKLLFCHVCLK